MGTYLRYFCLLLSLTLVMIYVAYLRINQSEFSDSPGIVISYPKTISKGDCDSVKLMIDEDQAFSSELRGAVLANSKEYLLETNSNIVLEAALVVPGMSVDPAGAVKRPWVVGTDQVFSWQVCSNAEGSFEGNLWIYIYVLTSNGTEVDKLPVSVYPIYMKVRSILGLSKAGVQMMLILLITGFCILGFLTKNKYSLNKKN